MSSLILEKLKQATAFKPKPPDYELAIAHIKVGELGIPQPIDDRVVQTMTTDDETFVIITGEPGSGKSSILTAAALAVLNPDEAPHPLPLTVAVGHHDQELTAEMLVKGIAQSLGYALRGHLSTQQATKLGDVLSLTRSTTKQGPSLNGSITGGHPGVLSGTVGAALGKDLVTLATNASWAGDGPVNTLLSLRDLADSHHARLIVLFHDTDIWSVADATMAKRARSFFSALRVLMDCSEVSIFVAVQTHWTQRPDDNDHEATADARREYHELAARAGVRLRVPRPRSNAQALGLIKAVIDRRVEIVLPDLQPPTGTAWSSALFTAEALEILAHRAKNVSIRQAINDIRDVLDNLEAMPEQIDREHIINVVGN